MAKWDYEVIWVDGPTDKNGADAMKRTLKSYGDRGWDVISLVPIVDANSATKALVVTLKLLKS